MSNDKAKLTIQVVTALISAMAVIIAAILGQESLVKELLKPFRTRTVTVHADPDFSGAAVYLAGDDLLTFAEASAIGAVGDTEEDEVTRGFLSFYLGDLPADAEIITAELSIPCGVEGAPESLGTLTLQEYAFEEYTQEDFYGVPADNWSVAWTDTAAAMAACKAGTPLYVSGKGLVAIAQQSLDSDWMQFVLYLTGDRVNPDGSADVLVLTSPPELVLKYR